MICFAALDFVSRIVVASRDTCNSVVSESDAGCAMTVPFAWARAAFEVHAQNVKNCPVSRALSSVDIHLRAKLL
jgi:hypothetical protein